MTLFGFVIRLIWRIPKYTADTDEQLNRNRSSELWIQLKCTGREGSLERLIYPRKERTPSQGLLFQ